MGSYEQNEDGIRISGDIDIDQIDFIEVNGQRYELVEIEPPRPVYAPNPFQVGNYVRVIVPKRYGHRVNQVGKVIAFTPTSNWDDITMPMVYVEFAERANGCGNAQGRAGNQHGCRMPVSGLVRVD